MLWWKHGNMTSAGLWTLIKCLCVDVNKFMTRVILNYGSGFLAWVMRNMKHLQTLSCLVYLEWMKCDDTCDDSNLNFLLKILRITSLPYFFFVWFFSKICNDDVLHVSKEYCESWDIRVKMINFLLFFLYFVWWYKYL